MPQVSSPHPIFNISFPAQRHVPQVKEFDVPVVITGTHTAILIIEGMTCNEKENKQF